MESSNVEIMNEIGVKLEVSNIAIIDSIKYLKAFQQIKSDYRSEVSIIIRLAT